VGVDGAHARGAGEHHRSPSSPRSTGHQVVVLAGGTGGAKLARGMQDVVGPEQLTVVANTGDDIEIYGAHVSPDPDLVSFWLADQIDERGWGLRGDSFRVMDGLRGLGVDVWFNLGDLDLAWCIERRRMLDTHGGTTHGGGQKAGEGMTPTAALARLNEALGVKATVLPMSDAPVRTWVHAEHGWRSFQEFMIRDRASGMIDGLEYRGAEQAPPSPEVLSAIAGARAIVIGPSNPLASIGPILALPGMREALAAAAAPVVAVSPIVGGEVLKGPTAAFMAFAALECNAKGITDFYGELLDGIVSDEPAPTDGPAKPPGETSPAPTDGPATPAGETSPAPTDGPPALQIDTRMADAPTRARVAEEVLAFADSLAG
jgi:LPPG:FO 2-phospho-L-lactate transferase